MLQVRCPSFFAQRCHLLILLNIDVYAVVPALRCVALEIIDEEVWAGIDLGSGAVLYLDLWLCSSSYERWELRQDVAAMHTRSVVLELGLSATSRLQYWN